MTVVALYPREDTERPFRSQWGEPAHMRELSDLAFLAALLRCPDAECVAGRLILRFGGLAGVFGADPFALRGVEGMGPKRVMDILLVQEAAVRIARSAIPKRVVIGSWFALTAYVKIAMAHKSREEFRVLFLNKKNALLFDEVMNEGTVDHAPVYPREVVRRALEVGASAVILVHNHPSGDPTPSAADVAITRRVIDAGKALDIAVHDHLVVGSDGVASLKALGLM